MDAVFGSRRQRRGIHGKGQLTLSTKINARCIRERRFRVFLEGLLMVYVRGSSNVRCWIMEQDTRRRRETSLFGQIQIRLAVPDYSWILSMTDCIHGGSVSPGWKVRPAIPDTNLLARLSAVEIFLVYCHLGTRCGCSVNK